jgi:hypothetical protein
MSNNRKRQSKQDKRHRQRCEKRNQRARSARQRNANAKHGRTNEDRRETKLAQPKILSLNFDVFVMKLGKVA